MPDDPNKREADAKRIDVSQEHERRYWSERFGVTAHELKRAVEKAGPMVEDVSRELGGQQPADRGNRGH
jgi:hypothetical protein